MTRTKSLFRCLPIEGVYKKAVFTAYQVSGFFANNCVLLVSNYCTKQMAENCDSLQTYKTFKKGGDKYCKKRVFNMLSEGSLKDLKNSLKGVTNLAFACPSYIVKRIFPERTSVFVFLCSSKQ